MLPALSILNSTRPALTSRTALAVSSVTVPVFGLGMRPRGPRTLPSLRTSLIASGVAMATSKPTNSAPAAFAASAEGPLLANTRTLTVLPLPCGSGTVPRTIWSDCFGSTPRRNARSTVSLNFALGNLAKTSTAAFSGYTFLATTTSSAFLYRLLGMLLSGASERELSRVLVLGEDFNAHAAGSPRNGSERGFFRGRVHVIEFQLHDLHDLLFGDLADLVLVRRLGTGGNASGFLEQDRSGRRLGDEGEGLVLVHGDDHGNHHAG